MLILCDARSVSASPMSGSRIKMPPGPARKRLDDAGLEAHFETLATRAQAIEIRYKDDATSHSDAAAAELGEAARRLRAGEVLAVQIRFFQDDDWWCDTVLRRGDSYRLVRMRQG